MSGDPAENVPYKEAQGEERHGANGSGFGFEVQVSRFLEFALQGSGHMRLVRRSLNPKP